MIDDVLHIMAIVLIKPLLIAVGLLAGGQLVDMALTIFLWPWRNQ